MQRRRPPITHAEEAYTTLYACSDLVDITYTRSSGPGGQNVNKGESIWTQREVAALRLTHTRWNNAVSTKANVRLDLGRLRAGVPSMKLPPLPATGMKMLAQQSVSRRAAEGAIRLGVQLMHFCSPTTLHLRMP